jgi:hypothetical protein
VGGSATRSSKAKPYRSWSEAREGRARRWRREESYGNLVDCAFSGVFVGWRPGGAGSARFLLNCAENLYHFLFQCFHLGEILAKQIDYLGGMPTVEPKTTVRTSEKANQMLQFDLENETETIRNYRERVRQCEELSEYAMGEQIREILIEEQDHQIALATALGKERASSRSRQIATMTNSCLGKRHRRIRIPACLPIMAIVTNECGTNG